MNGGIYTEEKCCVCGSVLKDNHRDAVCCPKHPQIRAQRFRIKFGRVRLRFKSYETARGTGHLSKAFLRYLDNADDQSRQLYQDAVPRKTNVLEFKKEAK